MQDAIKVYRTARGIVLQQGERSGEIRNVDWDGIFRRAGAAAYLAGLLRKARPLRLDPAAVKVLAPVGEQEVWASGVTYYRSRDARMEESKDAGGGDFYSRVYRAKRPELFFKSTPRRVVGPGGKVRIRRDSKWNVPEPELVLAINKAGRVFGYSIGNDMSSRDIEGENPLYLPQAKVYDGSCALGPCVLVTDAPIASSTRIVLRIVRGRRAVFEGQTTVAMLKRKPRELAEFLYRETSFPDGTYLFTGTGIVPPDKFTLRVGDDIHITIDGIGTLTNTVA